MTRTPPPSLVSRLSQRRRRGANAIEFALILPVFVTIMVGIMDFSWFFFVRSTVINAVRDGCRAGAVVPPDENPELVARAEMEDILATWNADCNDPNITCTFDIQASGSSPSEVLECSITLEQDPLIGLVPMPETTTASAVVHFELQR
ncbi:MAG: pilus assembly protein [Alphaproteobacteria bacterium]|nr:pilus assembly protein [Alphaproteobacteria bacterium]